MSDEPLPGAPVPEPWHRRVPARTMAIWLVLIAVVFVTRGRWEAWVEHHVLPFTRCPPHRADSRGTKIAVGHDKGLTLWDVEEGREIASFPPEFRESYRQFFADGTRFYVMPATGDAPSGAKVKPIVRYTPIVFDAETGERLFKLAAGALPASPASFSDDGRIFVPYQDGTNRIWNGVTGEVIADLRPSYSSLGGLTFSPDGSRLVTIGRDYKARLWDANSGLELHELGITQGIEPVKFTRSGSRVVVSRFLPDSGSCDILDTETGERIASMEVDQGYRWLVNAVSPDGRVVAGYSHGKVLVADAETGARLHQLHPRHPVGSLWFSQGSGFLLAHDFMDSDRWGSIWDVRTGRCVYTGPEHLVGTKFTPDGTRFVRKREEVGGIEIRSARTGGILIRMAQVKSFQVLNDDTMVISRDGGDIRIFRRTRPEWWWGIAWLPHFWVIAALVLVLALSMRRDVVQLRRSREGKGGAQA